MSILHGAAVEPNTGASMLLEGETNQLMHNHPFRGEQSAPLGVTISNLYVVVPLEWHCQ